MNGRNVCLRCLLRYGRQTDSTTRHGQTSLLIRFAKLQSRSKSTSQERKIGTAPKPRLVSNLVVRKVLQGKSYTVTPGETWELSESQQKELKKLKPMIGVLRSFGQEEKLDSLTTSRVVERMGNVDSIPPRLMSVFLDIIEEKDYNEALNELNVVTQHHTFPRRYVDRHSTKVLLSKLGIVQVEEETPNSSDQGEDHIEHAGKSEPAAGEEDAAIPALDPTGLQSLTARDAVLEPLELGEVNVPKLSFDLSRVLFNPGVYQLQDPRSRVYNFDPYLQRIMPVKDFDFEALNPYTTSSEDGNLQQLAAQHGKSYTASSSSMSSVMQHFHFLLSSWRTLNMESLSRGFQVETLNFTRIHRAPSAIFLRWRNGVYAVDADKEFDSANVLMSLGHSMEKLVTLDKDEFEQLRKSSTQSEQARERTPEQYHYGGVAKFLLRSQLDAHDPRLPGTGMFDLKTRAVVAVRMILSEYEKGLGYQIKDRQGTWESYEREYYDMMRSAFLKYSLQVRMGRMDGVFVTYHNVQSIFGFQYVSLPEMDLALHGQTDRSLGDQEFGLSIKLLSDIFDRVTRIYPEQSIRFHFESRESTAKVREAVHRMYIFAEPMSEEEIEDIQKSTREEIEAFERKVRAPVQESVDSNEEQGDVMQDELPAREVPDQSLQDKVCVREDNAANVEFLDSLQTLDLDEPSAAGGAAGTRSQSKNPVLGFELVVRSFVNGKPVIRPEKMTASDKWTLQHSLTPIREGQVEGKYNLCKARRKSALRDAQGEGQYTMNAYIQNLVKMSEEGAKWRQKHDEMDSRRERVVLYGD